LEGAISAGTKHFYEFGPFRLDPDERLLLRDNQPVPLQPKAFETLLVLVRHSETVVRKDDLMKSIWPGTFVEESNLSQNIFVLRKALGEEGSRYIVTVPGRGYRFACEVKAIGGDQEPGEELILRSHTKSDLVVEETKSHALLIMAVAILCVVVMSAGLLGYKVYLTHLTEQTPKGSGSAALKARRSVAVLGFRDLSGRPEDAWLSTALAEMLNTELAAGEKLRLVPGEDVARTRADLGLPDAESLSKDT
jgi:DNA-binding winged helix-turn-helix (wHTH) protein